MMVAITAGKRPAGNGTGPRSSRTTPGRTWIGAMASAREAAATRRSGASQGVTRNSGAGPPWITCDGAHASSLDA